MKRNEEVQTLIDNFARRAFGISQTKAKGKGALMPVCVFCKKPIDADKDFRNEISRKEFGISGICQVCQDEVFGKD